MCKRSCELMSCIKFEFFNRKEECHFGCLTKCSKTDLISFWVSNKSFHHIFWLFSLFKRSYALPCFIKHSFLSSKGWWYSFNFHIQTFSIYYKKHFHHLIWCKNGSFSHFINVNHIMSNFLFLIHFKCNGFIEHILLLLIALKIFQIISNWYINVCCELGDTVVTFPTITLTSS